MFVHSTIQANYCTPPTILTKVQEVLGTIDLDPCGFGGKDYASNILTQEADGLTIDWAPNSLPVSVFLNPPGGKRDGKYMYKLFFKRLLDYKDNNLLKHAIYLGFNASHTHSLQSDIPGASLLDYPTCVCKRRIQFVDPTTGMVAPSAKYNSVITYIPGTQNKSHEFIKVFSPLGKIVVKPFG